MHIMFLSSLFWHIAVICSNNKLIILLSACQHTTLSSSHLPNRQMMNFYLVIGHTKKVYWSSFRMKDSVRSILSLSISTLSIDSEFYKTSSSGPREDLLWNQGGGVVDASRTIVSGDILLAFIMALTWTTIYMIRLKPLSQGC